jgi:hypothetical protein
MRFLGSLIVVLAVGFLAVMGFYYWRDGSLQSAGAEVDEGLAKVDKTTQPLQDALGEVGEGAKESVDRATDGDDRT